MLEFGLDQAVSDGRQRLVSPTMGVASLDPQDGGTGEDFLEVRYHESQSEEGSEASPELSELMPHMHNSPVTTSLSSEPPESPTSPRDITFDAPASAAGLDAFCGKARKEAENHQRRRTASGCSSNDSDHGSITPAIHGPSQLGVHRASQSGSQGKCKSSALKIHSPHTSLSDEDGAGGGDHASVSINDHPAGGHLADPSEIAASPSKRSPLADVSSLTQISAVQTGHTLPNDREAVDDYVHQMEMTAGSFEMVSEGLAELTLSMDNSDPLLGRSDSVEELDSPESISKIDREDCFSWEEDRLQLSLAVDTDNASAPDSQSQGQGDASPEEQDSSSQDQPDSHSSDSTHTLTPHGSSPKKNGKWSRATKHGSPGRKTAALKSKLSTAFGKVRLRTKDTGSLEMKPIIKGEVSLQQDQFGFPLAIFTKVSSWFPVPKYYFRDHSHLLVPLLKMIFPTVSCYPESQTSLTQALKT